MSPSATPAPDHSASPQRPRAAGWSPAPPRRAVRAVTGQVFACSGQTALAEGASFADTRNAYDFAEAGREWDLEDHCGCVVTLKEFECSTSLTHTEEFLATVTISECGVPVTTKQILVHHPLRYKAMVLLRWRSGWHLRARRRGGPPAQTGRGSDDARGRTSRVAPLERVVVRAGDEVLVDERVRLTPKQRAEHRDGHGEGEDRRPATADHA